VGFLQRHNGFQVVEVNYMLELCSTPGWQVGSHWRTLEQFPGLEVVVHVLEIVNWVKDEKNRLPRHWIYDASLQLPLTQTVHKKLPVCRCVVNRNDNYVQRHFPQQSHYLVETLQLF